MGETSTLAALMGAGILIVTGVGSWRCMTGVVVGTFLMATFLNVVGSDTNPMFAVPFYWHFVLGGWAFGMVFMATDPVSAARTDPGRWVYGVGIGALTVVLRGYSNFSCGLMFAILIANMFAPLIDAGVKARQARRKAAGEAGRA